MNKKALITVLSLGFSSYVAQATEDCDKIFTKKNIGLDDRAERKRI